MNFIKKYLLRYLREVLIPKVRYAFPVIALVFIIIIPFFLLCGNGLVGTGFLWLIIVTIIGVGFIEWYYKQKKEEQKRTRY